MTDPLTDSILEDTKRLCLCGHNAGVHSMFGCLTCAATRAEECRYFISEVRARQLVDPMRGKR